MMEPDEKRWIQSTANELRNLHVVIMDAAGRLFGCGPKNSETLKQLDIIRENFERAAKITKLMEGRAAAAAPAPAPQPVSAPVVVPKPAASPAVPVHVDPPFEVTIANPAGPRELVLVVDDEEFITQLARDVLTDSGYRVVTAGDGLEALHIYKKLKDQISLVVLDYSLPGMDGPKVFDELGALNAKARVVLSTGRAEDVTVKGMLARGLRGFIPKPYSIENFLERIRYTLDLPESSLVTAGQRA